MTLYLTFATRSDRGLIRTNNQDSAYAGPRLLAVADGMGGHVAGEVASKIVIAALEPLDEDVPGDDILDALRDATADGSAHMREMIDNRPELDGMGTTLTVLLFAGSRIALCHVGDSRAYLLRGGELTQISHDHSFVQALVDEGRISPEEASVHPQRSVILRALNGSEVQPDLSVREARAGDRYLICSDGLSDSVSTDTIRDGLSHGDVESAAENLVELALRGGGHDNITVVIADVVNDDHSDGSGFPVVDGAAGGNVGQRQVTATSPAARAALIGSPRPTPDDEPDDDDDLDPQRSGGRRRWITLLLILLVLVGLFFAGRTYINSQYFVGVSDDTVVIYNGVNTSIGPLALYSVAEQTDLSVADLTDAGKNTVQGGVDAASLSDARAIVERLRRQQLPACGAAASTPPTSSASASGAAPADSSAASGGSLSSGGSSTSDGPSASGASGAATSSSAAATVSQTPGVDCRVS